MSSREIDIQIAEMMGWRKHLYSNFPEQMQPPDKPVINGIDQVRSIPPYSSDIAAAMQMEAHIDTLARYNGQIVPHVVTEQNGTTTRGLPIYERYVLNLMREVGIPECEVTTASPPNRVGHRFNSRELWALIHATPEQRCLAALASVQVSERGGEAE